MLTISEFLEIVSLCIAAFGLGYEIGRDRRNKENDDEEA